MENGTLEERKFFWRPFTLPLLIKDLNPLITSLIRDWTRILSNDGVSFSISFPWVFLKNQLFQKLPLNQQV